MNDAYEDWQGSDKTLKFSPRCRTRTIERSPTPESFHRRGREPTFRVEVGGTPRPKMRARDPGLGGLPKKRIKSSSSGNDEDDDAEDGEDGEDGGLSHDNEEDEAEAADSTG